MNAEVVKLSSLRPLEEECHKSSTVLAILMLMLKICLDTTAMGFTEHAPEKERKKLNICTCLKESESAVEWEHESKLNNEQHCDGSYFKHGIHQSFLLK